MDNQLKEEIAKYRTKILKASKESTKKEHFKDLLHRLYGGKPDINALIDTISAGAEHTVLSIPKKNQLHRGSADTLYNKIIIEFENDLRKTGNHAKEQLAGYLLGQFAYGEGYNYTLIASDFITWKVYAPSISQLSELHNLNAQQLVLDENEGGRFVLLEGNEEDFYFWIDRYLFKEGKQKATLSRVEQAFGYQSATFIDCYRLMAVWFKETKKYGEIQVSLEQWRKFLSIAYGNFSASDETFLIHTYLSVFSKMLAYSVVSGDDYIDEKEMKGILDGSVFNTFKIGNFVENDFFHWVNADRNFNPLKKVFRLIAQEIANYDFKNVDEDVLKGVYQELIDLDTRHSLGEYYTPDWLCERVVKEFNFKTTDKILDPSCGSGSFLRAAIHRLKELNPEITVEEINDAVYGIDIHPLSVQIAKTTLLIALGTDVQKAKKSLKINILLANTLLAPDDAITLFGNDFTLQIDRQQKRINTNILNDPILFDTGLDLCEELADQTAGKIRVELEKFNTIFFKLTPNKLSIEVINSFYEIYLAFKKVKEDGRDSIWKFILSNTYKPFFMKSQFDYVIGNPPWFTYASIPNGEYQNQLLTLAETYNIKPKNGKNLPHLEIAAIFLAHCTNYFLRENNNQTSRLAFVLPRSFYDGDQHENTREGIAKGFQLTELWDLNKINPLFRIPSCVLFAQKVKPNGQIKYSNLPGIELKGNLPAHNCNWIEAEPKVKETKIAYFIGKLGKASAFTTNEEQLDQETNPYKKLFKQGATIVPRAFYFVTLKGPKPDDFIDRTLVVQTAKNIQADAKKPWKDIHFDGYIESRYLFYTAISRSILPYCIFNLEYVVLPIHITKDDLGKSHINIKAPTEIMLEADLYASRWFQNRENIWEIHRTEKNKNITAYDYLNWKNKVQDQNLDARYIVIYNASAKNANAGVLDRESLEIPFIAESTCYTYCTKNILEAHYLIAFLNSNYANSIIKDFQAKGLFGPRHVHKLILNVYFPKFDGSNQAHVELGNASLALSEMVSKFIAAKNIKNVEGAIALGKLRNEIKEQFNEPIAQIEQLVLQVIWVTKNKVQP